MSDPPSSCASGPLTVRDVKRVVESYRQVREHGGYAELFYLRLLQRHPFSRALFPDDLASQATVFEQTIDTLIAHAGDLAAFDPTLAELGRRHVRYRVRPAHYDAVGEVLIDTFAELIGDRFTPPVREAWARLYRDVAERMQRGAAAP